MVGEIFREARERQGLTIADIEDATNIKRSYIEAIEEGRYDALPGAVYARGFVKNYAECLKLDTEAMLGAFREETGGKKEEKPAEAKTVAKPSATKPTLKDLDKASFDSGRDYKSRVEESNSRLGLFTAAAIILLAFVGSIYYFFGEGNPTGRLAVLPTEQPEVANSASASVKLDGVEVAAVFSSRCWTLVLSDGQKVYEGVPESGTRLNWRAKKALNITAGNAGAVDITYNGKTMGKLGKAGDVIEMRYTVDKAEQVK